MLFHPQNQSHLLLQLFVTHFQGVSLLFSSLFLVQVLTPTFNQRIKMFVICLFFLFIYNIFHGENLHMTPVDRIKAEDIEKNLDSRFQFKKQSSISLL